MLVSPFSKWGHQVSSSVAVFPGIVLVEKRLILLFITNSLHNQLINIQGGPKVSLHTLGLIPTSCFILEGCCFADGIL